MTNRNELKSPSDHLPTIYGENANSIASMLEYLQLPNHPFHDQAKAQAAAFLESHRQARIESNQRTMRMQRENLTAEEWAGITD